MIVACIASGPSLTDDDIELVRASGVLTITANSAWYAAQFAEIAYGCDAKWWAVNIDNVTAQIKMTHANNAGVQKAETFDVKNSGANIIAIAESLGATKIVLLGYDCQRTGGKSHFHGDHPYPLRNCDNIDKWPAKFAQMAAKVKADVVNCSRETALTCFRRGVLEVELCAQ